MTSTALSLDGVRILDLSRVLAGPFCGMLLADLGADVIKIEDPGVGGDVARYVPPFAGEADSPYFQSFNRGKRSITLNLRHPDGQGVFHDLVRVSGKPRGLKWRDCTELLYNEYRSQWGMFQYLLIIIIVIVVGVVLFSLW